MTTDNTLHNWLTFTLGKETYGVDVRYVQEVLPYTETSPVPGALPHVFGMITVRGKILAVNDLHTIIRGKPNVKITDATRIVLINRDTQTLGILVDSVTKIVNIEYSEITLTSIDEERNSAIIGTCYQCGKLYILLSIHELMRNE